MQINIKNINYKCAGFIFYSLKNIYAIKFAYKINNSINNLITPVVDEIVHLPGIPYSSNSDTDFT